MASVSEGFRRRAPPTRFVRAPEDAIYRVANFGVRDYRTGSPPMLGRVGGPGFTLYPSFPSAPTREPAPPCRPKGALAISQRIRIMGRLEVEQRWRRRRSFPRVRFWACVFGRAAPTARAVWRRPEPTRRRYPGPGGGVARSAPSRRAFWRIGGVSAPKIWRAAGFPMHLHARSGRSEINIETINCRLSPVGV